MILFRSAFFFALLSLFLWRGGVAIGGEPVRIISMAPHITEIIYALGMQDNLVGVTDFCKYPKEAKDKPKIGGLLNPSYEAIAALRPTIVIYLSTREQIGKNLAQLGINSLRVENESLDSIIESVGQIGRAIGREKVAGKLAEQMRQKISELTDACKKSKKPRVLVSIERNIKAGGAKISESYLAGSSSFYGDLLARAGAKNVYTERKIKYPKLGGEGLLTIDPDIVIDIVSTDKTDISREELTEAWRNLFSTRAGKSELPVYIIDSDYAVIPGIRSIKLLEDFARIIKSINGGCD